VPDGRLYLYGNFDDQENGWCSEKYHVVSTADMENWTIHEMALNGKDIPWLNNPDAPKYLGIDWSRPTPFMRKIQASAGEYELVLKFEEAEKLEVMESVLR